MADKHLARLPIIAGPIMPILWWFRQAQQKWKQQLGVCHTNFSEALCYGKIERIDRYKSTAAAMLQFHSVQNRIGSNA